MPPKSEAEYLAEASHGHGTNWSEGTSSSRPGYTRFNCLEHLTEDDTKKLLALLRSDQPYAGNNGWMTAWADELGIPHFNDNDVLLAAQAFLQQDYEHQEIVATQAEGLGVRGYGGAACRLGRVRLMTVEEVDALETSGRHVHMLKVEAEIRRVYLETDILQEDIEKKQKEAAVAKEKE